MTTAKYPYSEPLLTKAQVLETLAKALSPEQLDKNAEFHDAHIKEHIERMRGTEALHVDVCNAPLDGIGDIIHLDMDPYLVKLRELHEATKALKAAWEKADDLGDIYDEICAMNRVLLALEQP